MNRRVKVLSHREEPEALRSFQSVPCDLVFQLSSYFDKLERAGPYTDDSAGCGPSDGGCQSDIGDGWRRKQSESCAVLKGLIDVGGYRGRSR